MTAQERALLRELATRVAEVAALPIQAERRARWVQHNRLQPGRPMILLFPEGAWRELLPESVLQCQSETARGIEWELRRRLYYHDHLDDDTVIEGNWVVSKVIHSTGWGLDSKHTPSTEQLGAWAFDPVILSPADLKKLHAPEITYDEAATQAPPGVRPGAVRRHPGGPAQGRRATSPSTSCSSTATCAAWSRPWWTWRRPRVAARGDGHLRRGEPPPDRPVRRAEPALPEQRRHLPLLRRRGLHGRAAEAGLRPGSRAPLRHVGLGRVPGAGPGLARHARRVRPAPTSARCSSPSA